MLDLDDQLDRFGLVGPAGLGGHQSVEKEPAFGLTPRRNSVAISRERLAGGAGTALEQVAGHVGAAEAVNADIVDKGGQGIALPAGQRSGNAVIDHFLGAHHIIDEQQRRFVLGDTDAGLGGSPVTIADNPAAGRVLLGVCSEGLKPLDQVAGSRRSVHSRFHACSVSGRRAG